MLYIHHKETNVKVLGPGRRYVIWVQGCKKSCSGCINPEGRSLNSNGYYINVQDLYNEIRLCSGISGVTISGGEPFLQADKLSVLIKSIKENTALDVMVYSGYTLQELRDMEDDSIDYILNHIDILVDGEYIEEENNNSIYRGSDNQVIHFLSKKFLPYKDVIYQTHNRNIEFVYRNDELFMVGIPAKDFSKNIWKTIANKEY